jgi:NADH-quinone oxidoreductase subunit B
LKRTYVFERTGMPPAAQTDVGWIPEKKHAEQGGGQEEPASPKGSKDYSAKKPKSKDEG